MPSARPSVIAGQWYPGTALELEQTIKDLFTRVDSAKLDQEIVGLISPHAGYAYSGQVAAHAYNQVRGRPFDAVAIVSPVHRVPVGRFAITAADAYETPLGQVPLAQGLVRALEDQVPIRRVGYDGEHSLEIQLPFLQVALQDLKLLPVMIGAPSFAAGKELGLALASVIGEQKVLLVASTDLHHIPDYDQVVKRDQRVIDAISSFDLECIKESLSAPDCSVCGRIPVYTVLTAAKELGADSVEVLHYTNSGDVTGMRTPGQYTVGYMAAAVCRSG
jgi:AmmeMemoRadiSam system protein B